MRFPKQAPPDWRTSSAPPCSRPTCCRGSIWGARTAIEVVVLAVVFSLAIGVPLGLISGYVGGRLDRVLVLIMDALFAFPYLLLAIVIAFLLSDKIGQGIVTAAIAITVVYVPQYFRVVRNHVISVREESYVEAARALGAPRRTIIQPLRALERDPERARDRDPERRRRDPHPGGARLPRLRDPADRGRRVGLRPQRAIDDAGAGIWWTGLFPGLAIVLLVTGFTLVGEGLNDVLNPLIRERRIRPAARSRRRRRRARRTPRASGDARVSERRRRSSRVRDLRVWYGTEGDPVRAVDGVSLEIRRRRDARPGRRVGLRQVDPRPRRPRPAAGQRARSPARCAIAGRDLVGLDAEGDAASCAGPSSG